MVPKKWESEGGKFVEDGGCAKVIYPKEAIVSFDLMAVFGHHLNVTAELNKLALSRVAPGLLCIRTTLVE